MEAKYTEKENEDLRSKIFALETLRQKSWLERKLGPLWYKIVRGVFTNPLSVIGLVITLVENRRDDRRTVVRRRLEPARLVQREIGLVVIE